MSENTLTKVKDMSKSNQEDEWPLNKFIQRVTGIQDVVITRFNTSYCSHLVNWEGGECEGDAKPRVVAVSSEELWADKSNMFMFKFILAGMFPRLIVKWAVFTLRTLYYSGAVTYTQWFNTQLVFILALREGTVEYKDWWGDSHWHAKFKSE